MTPRELQAKREVELTPRSNAEQVVDQLLNLKFSELCAVLHRVADERPALKLSFYEPNHHINGWHGLPAPHSPRESTGSLTDPDSGTARQNDGYTLIPPTSQIPVDLYSCQQTFVQFAASEFFCMDGDESIEIQVNRNGDKSKESSVKYYTQDHSVNSGTRYVHQEGTVVFPPGEIHKTFTVHLKESICWEGLAEFRIFLQFEGAYNCCPASQLQFTRVKIIEDTPFPSSLHADLLVGGIKEKVEQIHWVALLLEYIYMLFAVPKIRHSTIKALILDFMHPLQYAVHLLCTIYLLDDVVKLDKPVQKFWIIQDRLHMLLLLAAAEAFSVVVLHLSDHARFLVPMGGAIRKLLTQGIMMIYLNFDPFSEGSDFSGALTMGLTRDAVECAELYKVCLKWIQHVGSVAVLFLFMVLYPRWFGKEFTTLSYLPFIFFPMVLSLFICCRAKIVTGALTAQKDAQDDVVTTGNEAVLNRALILDYKLRQDFCDSLYKRVHDWNIKRKIVSLVDKNNQRFMVWMSTVLMGWWTIYGGTLVIEQKMTVGIFVATFKVYDKVARAFASSYEVILMLQVSMPALMRVCTMINSPTDLKTRYHYELDKRRETHRQVAKHGRDVDAPLNLIPIVVENLVFNFGSGMAARQIKFSGKVELLQNTLVAVVGPEGQGKSTFMKVIGGAFVPHLDSGKVFIPGHLRMLHVEPEPMFFRGSMLYNLTAGCSTEVDKDPVRVKKVLDALGVPRNFNIHREELELNKWKKVLNLSTGHKLNIARALIANPHFLCMNRPTLVFEREMASQIISLLRKFVDERGLFDEHSFASRRPRTCVFTDIDHDGAKHADVVYRLEDNKVEKVIDFASIS